MWQSVVALQFLHIRTLLKADEAENMTRITAFKYDKNVTSSSQIITLVWEVIQHLFVDWICILVCLYDRKWLWFKFIRAFSCIGLWYCRKRDYVYGKLNLGCSVGRNYCMLLMEPCFFVLQVEAVHKHDDTCVLMESIFRKR